jgi:hypothetical protein
MGHKNEKGRNFPAFLVLLFVAFVGSYLWP